MRAGVACLAQVVPFRVLRCGTNWHTSFCSCPWRKVLELPALTEFEVALFDNRVGEAAEGDFAEFQDFQT